jgi:hypothetical protein
MVEEAPVVAVSLVIKYITLPSDFQYPFWPFCERYSTWGLTGCQSSTIR